MPKIIQVAIEPDSENDYATLYALTSDGRIFKKVAVGYQDEKDWEEIETDSMYEKIETT